MIPIRDDNPTRITPVVTWALLAANVAVFGLQLAMGERAGDFIWRYAVVPADLTSGPAGIPEQVLLTPITSMFLHGGLMHLAGNMLYLHIFGNNVEEAMGHVRFLLFYLACGTLAALGHVLAAPLSQVPVVGASGAISGVLAAYLLLFPKARVLTLVPLGFFIQMVRLPAVFLLGIWIVVQIVSGLASGPGGGGVAWFAHVGGFVAGLVLVGPFKRRGVPFWGGPG